MICRTAFSRQFVQALNNRSCRRQSLNRVRAMSTAGRIRFEVAVKGFPKDGAQDSLEGRIGDCPFCQRVLLTLEEKRIHYAKRFVDLSNKPAWLWEANPEGTTPVLKDEETGEWVPDSGAIVDYIEDRYPEPPTGHVADSKKVGDGLFPAFVGFLKSFDSPHEEEKKAELEQKLAGIEAFFEENGEDNPFIHGRSPGVNDFELAPKLHHIDVITHHYRAWIVRRTYPKIGKYLEYFQSLPIWTATEYPDEVLLKAWALKIPTK